MNQQLMQMKKVSGRLKQQFIFILLNHILTLDYGRKRRKD
jgi:hypothetical protein